MSVNKFLGIDSINVIKDYIDNEILKRNDNTRVLTIQAYRYFEHNEEIELPEGGSFDPEHAEIIYPTNWYSLEVLIKTLTGIENFSTEQTVELDNKLKDGSIYMSAGVLIGTNVENWSTPVKISGQNAVNIQFAYAYNIDATEEERTATPQGVNAIDRIEYVWIKYNDTWSEPTIWAMYSADATNVVWRYCLSADVEDGTPINSTPWSLDLPLQAITEEYPYMWMSYKIIPARPIDDIEDEPNTTTGWTSPVLFGHYGKDGQDGVDGKDGIDGNVPDYNVTLYTIGNDLDVEGSTPGMGKPDAPITNTDTETTLQDFRNLNTNWIDLPEDDTKVWWQCTIKVNGQTNEIMTVGAVKRYNAIDGNALPGQFTKYLYAWSKTYTDCPALDTQEDTLIDGWRPDGWYERPDYDQLEDWNGEVISTLAESSIWMISSTADGYNINGLPNIGSWSNPVRISGPRGPISYDYRIETRYNIGTATNPKALPTEEEWQKNAPAIEAKYPYVWAVNYLMCYTMGYDKNGKIVTLDEGTVIESYAPYRLSGIDGEDGSRKNSLKYSNTTETIEVTSFSENNLYISNSDSNVTYNITLDKLSFINGYTGKFANIGIGVVTINAGEFKFIGSCTESTTITLNPQESIELVCYNNGNNKELIVIGKSL